MENAFSGGQVDNVLNETLLTHDSVSVREGQLSSPAPDAKAKIDGQKPLKRSGSRGQRSWRGRGRFPCQNKNCENPSSDYWHPVVRKNYKSETGCIYGKKCRFRHVEAEEKPSNKSKKGGAKASVALKEDGQLGCVSQDSHPRKSILRKAGTLGSNQAVNFSKTYGAFF